MTARLFQALLVAGVENPSLIARWRDDPQLLRDFGLDPAKVDLAALWRFAALTIKLRHNALRDELPSTFRLIRAAGLELELFAAYASDRAARHAPLAPTSEARARDLIAFLDRWLDRSLPVHALLWDVIRHERALTRLGKTAPAIGSSPYLQSPAAITRPAPTDASVPRIQGEIVLHEMTSDPQAVASALRDTPPRLAAIPRAAGFRCYWRAEDSPQVAIFELDELGYYALSLVDGARTAAGLYLGVGGTGRPDPTFLQMLGQLETLGVIALSQPG